MLVMRWKTRKGEGGGGEGGIWGLMERAWCRIVSNIELRLDWNVCVMSLR